MVGRFQVEHHPRGRIVSVHPGFPLFSEVVQGIESQGPVELLLVDPVASLDLSVVLWRPRPYELVADPVGGQKRLQGVWVSAAVSAPLASEGFVGELAPVVGLEHLGGVSEEGDRLLQGVPRLVHRMLRGEIEEPLPAGLVEDRVLVVPLAAGQLWRLAFAGDELHVHLPLLADVLGRVVFSVVPLFGVRAVRLVAVEPFQDPQAGGIGYPAAGGEGFEPYVDRRVHPAIGKYLVWFRDKRIKARLGNTSSKEYLLEYEKTVQ